MGSSLGGKLALIGLLLLLLCSAAPPSFAALSKPDSVELLLRFKPGAGRRACEVLLRSISASIVDEISQIKVLVIRVPRSAVDKVRSALARNPVVDFVEENRVVGLALTPNDPYYSSQWHLPKIGAPYAWDISVGSQSIIIAVLDSGVDPTHPDLAGKLLQGWNFYDNNADTNDIHGHGTKVAGTAAAIANNGIGVASVAWSCPILPVRVTDPNGYTTYSLLSKGLVYAADRGARVAIMSFHVFNGSTTLTSAAKYLMEKGGLAVAAGGNTGVYENYSDNPYIISVSATTSSDAIASFSSYGPYIDLSAPGVSIYTTFKGGGYGASSGTSFSAPIVAGVIALIFSVNPSLAPSKVEQILEDTAVDLGAAGYDVYYGWGRVEAYEALRAAASISTPPDVAPPSVEITYPRSGDTVSGGVTVSVRASDDVGVVKVELYINGVLFATDQDEPYEFYWDTTADPDGEYTLVAKAYDAAGNVGESSPVVVKVANVRDVKPPTVSIVSPQDGSRVSRFVDIVVSAYDESGISKVEFYINGRLVATDTSEPYSYRWNSRSVRDGWYTITVKAYDKYGNAAEASVKVYVSNRS